MACERAPPGRLQNGRSARAQRIVPLVAGTKLAAQPESLLEVISEDLVVRMGALRGRVVDPPRETLVQVRANLLRHLPVCDIADKHVREPEDLVARGHMADEIPACECFDDREKLLVLLQRRQNLEIVESELLPDERRALDERPLFG